MSSQAEDKISYLPASQISSNTLPLSLVHVQIKKYPNLLDRADLLVLQCLDLKYVNLFFVFLLL